jgi:hypothetical protein
MGNTENGFSYHVIRTLQRVCRKIKIRAVRVDKMTTEIKLHDRVSSFTHFI